jgi:hypothetical protein
MARLAGPSGRNTMLDRMARTRRAMTRMMVGIAAFIVYAVFR